MPTATDELPETQTDAFGGGPGRPPGTRNGLADAMPHGRPVPRESIRSTAVTDGGAAVVTGMVLYWLVKWLWSLFVH